MTILTSICKSKLSRKIRAISGELELFGSLVKWRSDFVDCDIADCSELVDSVGALDTVGGGGTFKHFLAAHCALCTLREHTVHTLRAQCAHLESTVCTF